MTSAFVRKFLGFIETEEIEINFYDLRGLAVEKWYYLCLGISCFGPRRNKIVGKNVKIRKEKGFFS